MTHRVPYRSAALVAAFCSALLGNPVVRADASHARQQRTSRLDATLRAAAADGSSAPCRVIIRVRSGSRPWLRSSLAAHGDQVLSEHDSIEAVTAVVHGADLGALAASDAVLSVSSDAVVRPHGLLGGLLGTVGSLLNVVGSILLPNGADTSGPVVSPAVLRQTLGVDNSTWSGRGVGVAVIDSGLEMSADFQYRLTAFYDFTNGRSAVASPYDDYGHGTHVAGIIGGAGALSYNAAYHGIAPKVKFVVLKVLDKTGAGYTSDVIRAVDFAVANRASLGIDIINLSLGHPILEPAADDPLVQAVERASRAGIIVVAAAGNYGKSLETGLPGYGGITSPGNAPSAITVGAVNTQNTVARGDDRIASYSSAGPTWYDGYAKPDIVSPGHNVVATAAKRGYLYQTYSQLKADDQDYMLLSGTSMAAAATTGSIALLLEANRSANGYPAKPSLTPNAVKALLQYTSVGVHDQGNAPYDALRKGAGSLNAKGAIDLGRIIDSSTPTGQWWLTTSSNPWTRIGGETLGWTQGIIWGNAFVWGSTIGVNEEVWGSAFVWGSAVSWGSAFVWGANLVWTDPQSWADAVVWGSTSIGTTTGDAVVWGATGGLTSQSTAWKDLSQNTIVGSTMRQ